MIGKIRSLLNYFYDVPWCVPPWGPGELRATLGSLLSGNVVTGPSAEQFGVAVRQYLGLRFAVPVNRGRTAIEIALRSMGVGPGHDVVLPSFICRSVLDSVLNTGAAPVFADIGDDLNVNAQTVEVALTPKTRCVIVAHLFGVPAAIDDIERLLARRGIAMIDDAAQALGGRRAGRPIGSFGDCGIVSCGPGKPLAGAAGGLLVTNDRRLYNRAMAILPPPESKVDVRQRAMSFWLWRRMRRYMLPLEVVMERLRGAAFEPPHVNAALSNLDAAIGLSQFSDLETNLEQRRQNARILMQRLADLPGMPVTDFSASAMVVKLVYVLPEAGPSVPEAIDILASHGIEAQGGYAALHSLYTNDAACPNTASLVSRVLCIPLETRPSKSSRIPFQRPSTLQQSPLRVPRIAASL